MFALILLYMYFGMSIRYPPILPNSLTIHVKRIHSTMCSNRVPSIIRIPYPFLTSLLSFSPEKDCGQWEPRKQHRKESGTTNHHHWVLLRQAALGFVRLLGTCGKTLNWGWELRQNFRLWSLPSSFSTTGSQLQLYLSNIWGAFQNFQSLGPIQAN